MCGINGIIKLNNSKVDRCEIEEMNKEIAHRGPDDTGIYIDKNIGLGHQRLSIVDLSQRGHQPFIYEYKDKKIVIVYNGEIYNYKEIREELREKGYEFNSNTDTEVVAALYIDKGRECLKRFNGMFSFAIYDLDKNIVFGARDRFGQKPLKYYFDDRAFIFSSELKAILKNKIKREVDFEAVDDYLSLQYVPAPKTGFKGIFKLPHSHYLVFDIKKKDLSVKRYFDLDYSLKNKITYNREAKKKVKRLVENSIEKRLLADVPLGVFLSGGLDSAVITAIASRFKKKIKTFTISFSNDSVDAKYAKIVSEKYNTNHTEFKVTPKELLKSIKDLAFQFEEPFADSSQLPTYLVSKLASNDAKVVLTGDGSDENFAGYDKHKYHLGILKTKKLFFLFMFLNKFIKNRNIDTILSHKDHRIARMHYNFTNYFTENEKKQIYKKEYREKLNARKNVFEKILENKKEYYSLDKIFYLDFNSYVPGDINVKIDMASMANSIEARSPMLDFELVEYLTKIKSDEKFSLFDEKKILKKIFKFDLPKKVLNRKKKGFSVPLVKWLEKDLKGFSEEIIFNQKGIVLEIMNEKELKYIFKNKKKNAKKIWSLIMLNLWHRSYFK